jgi:hypothetical protein
MIELNSDDPSGLRNKIGLDLKCIAHISILSNAHGARLQSTDSLNASVRVHSNAFSISKSTCIKNVVKKKNKQTSMQT